MKRGAALLAVGTMVLALGCHGAARSELDAAGGSAAAGSGAGGLGLGVGGQSGGSDMGGACAVATEALTARPVDLVFAIDQSASMGEEIQGVLDNLNGNLLTILAGAQIDYRVVLPARS
ncbi:MAG: hypothetical protein HY908_01430 [Myxococcales bacterium]|nr:hypothetical protein [Myxococcales bacterium]